MDASTRLHDVQDPLNPVPSTIEDSACALLHAAPLPGDRSALEAQVRLLDEFIARVEAETHEDFVHGCEALLERKQELATQAQARYERVKASAAMLFEYECGQARARYVARCEQLQSSMSDELQREIRRLQQTRDGVSVMDRRRLTRHSGGGANGSNGSAAGGSGSMGGAGGVGSDTLGDGDASVTTVQLAEKKRLEMLLSATPVFLQLKKTVEPDEIADDLLEIQQMRVPRPGTVRRRFELSDPERKSAGHGDDTDDEEEREDVRVDGCKRRRLQYNADMIQEGEAVVVTRGEDDVMFAGVITAATATQVYVRTATGEFERIDIRDWTLGHVRVHAVDGKSSSSSTIE